MQVRFLQGTYLTHFHSRQTDTPLRNIPSATRQPARFAFQACVPA